MVDWWWCDGDGGYVVEGDGVVQVLVIWCRMMVWWRVVDGDGVVKGGGASVVDDDGGVVV